MKSMFNFRFKDIIFPSVISYAQLWTYSGPGSSLGVELHSEHRLVLMHNSLISMVVLIHKQRLPTYDRVVSEATNINLKNFMNLLSKQNKIIV